MPRWTSEDLIAFERRKIRPADSGSTAIMERTYGDGPLAARADEKQDAGKFIVRITSRRRRLLDEDNLCEKFVVDCCRYAGLIPDDAPGCARIEVRQEKIGRGEPEEILIEIERI